MNGFSARCWKRSIGRLEAESAAKQHRATPTHDRVITDLVSMGCSYGEQPQKEDRIGLPSV
jgi:hypothetical protein